MLFPKSDFGKRSEARNRLLVDLLARTEFMEKAGTGIKRVRNTCFENGNKCIFNFTDAFWITIHSNNNVEVNIADVTENVTENVTDNVTDNVTERRHKLIIDEVRLNNAISIDQLAEKLNVTRRTIIRDIEKMRKKEIISRIGPDKGGYWKII